MFEGVGDRGLYTGDLSPIGVTPDPEGDRERGLMYTLSAGVEVRLDFGAQGSRPRDRSLLSTLLVPSMSTG